MTIPANNEATLSKHYTANITLSDVAKSMLVHKHIISIQELDNGNYLVEFAGHSEEMEREEEAMGKEEEEERGHDEEHEEEDKYHHDDDKDASYHDEDSEDEKDKMKEDDEEEKDFSSDDLLFHLRELNN